MKYLNYFLMFFCIVFWFTNQRVRAERDEAYETACALSDIIRMYACNHNEDIMNEVDYYFEEENFEHIDSINWNKYSWGF